MASVMQSLEGLAHELALGCPVPRRHGFWVSAFLSGLGVAQGVPRGLRPMSCVGRAALGSEICLLCRLEAGGRLGVQCGRPCRRQLDKSWPLCSRPGSQTGAWPKPVPTGLTGW